MKPKELVIIGGVVKCGNCKATLGEAVSFGPLDMIRIAGMNVKAITGFCTRCNHEFHWYVADKFIHKLIEQHGGSES